MIIIVFNSNFCLFINIYSNIEINIDQYFTINLNDKKISINNEAEIIKH